MKKGQNKTKTQPERKGKNVNEYWLDDVLEQPENKHAQPDGSVIYGYTDEPSFCSMAYFQNIKNGLHMVWQAKKPFNDHRSVMKAFLPLVHPDMYRIFFPFSYLAGLIAPIITRDKESRRNALYRFFESSLGEILLLCLFGFLVCGIVIGWVKIIAPLFNDL